MEVAKQDFTLEDISELIDLVKKVHGFDFASYSQASFKRRITRILMIKNLSFYDLKHRLVNDYPFFQEFLDEITVNVTEMFRDPLFYKALNTQVLPYLSTYQHIKIWSAGCSSGEEAYSLAILLKEAALKYKAFIYGTDVNTIVSKRSPYRYLQFQKYQKLYRKLPVIRPRRLTYRSFYGDV